MQGNKTNSKAHNLRTFPKIKQDIYFKLNLEEAHHVLENSKLE